MSCNIVGIGEVLWDLLPGGRLGISGWGSLGSNIDY